MTNDASVYFRRFECRPPLISSPLPLDTKLIIVIPCYNEPDLLTTLKSLNACTLTHYSVEVIVVINEPKDAPLNVSQRNQHTREEAQAWIEARSAQLLSFHVLYLSDLPTKHAGVGLARKIGMDEALRRFAAIDYDGWIVCLDADCEVAKNYLVTLETEFLERTPNSATIYFEHRLSAVMDVALRKGIIYYELFLRYYVNALRYAGFRYAMHTVGSSMAVRATVYARTGGMNRRRAGEDFYFLHKVAPHSNLLEITETTVYPSARVSARVPFGTGRAQADWLRGERRTIYCPEIFEELKTFFSFVAEEYDRSPPETVQLMQELPGTLLQFLQEFNYLDRVTGLKAETTQLATFERRFFSWFDGFMVLKYVHYARDHEYGSVPLPEATQELLKKQGQHSVPSEAEALLRAYRSLDRSAT